MSDQITNLSRASLETLMHANRYDDDPRKTVVITMVAAAMAQMSIDRSREKAHETLDDIWDAAQMIFLEATETSH